MEASLLPLTYSVFFLLLLPKSGRKALLLLHYVRVFVLLYLIKMLFGGVFGTFLTSVWHKGRTMAQ